MGVLKDDLQCNIIKESFFTDLCLIHYTYYIIMLGEEFTGKSCYANFFKLKNKVMLSEFHVKWIHVRRGLPVYYTLTQQKNNVFLVKCKKKLF